MATNTGAASLTLYIPGRYPSARELADLLILFESSLVWSQIALSAAEYRKHTDAYHENNDDAELELHRRWREVLDPLTASFDGFVRAKYEQTAFHVMSTVGGGYPPVDSLARLLDRGENRIHEIEHLIERILMDYPFRPERTISQLASRYALTGSAFNVTDFSEWIAEHCGRKLLRVDAVNPDSSIAFGFDVAAIAAIIALQNYPTIKDTITYSCGVLRSYMGNIKKPLPNETMEPPKLTPSMLQFLGQYDDVSVVWDGHNSRMELTARRDSTNAT